MSLDHSNPETRYLGPGDDHAFNQLVNFVINDQDRCPIVLVVNVSGLMARDIGLLNDAIESLRQTILEDPVTTVRVATALVASNHQTTVAHDFSSIDGFHPDPLTASRGTRLCSAVDHAQDLVEDRKPSTAPTASATTGPCCSSRSPTA